ncbi:MAG TPA: hypothetical protein VFL86_27360 [Burkholderiaceae bacterium]|nr:hypothetical protein [Burkholderiaceae bacterium]
MSIQALPSFTPQILNATAPGSLAAGFPMLPQSPCDPLFNSIQQFSRLMQEKPDDEQDPDEASL